VRTVVLVREPMAPCAVLVLLTPGRVRAQRGPPPDGSAAVLPRHERPGAG